MTERSIRKPGEAGQVERAVAITGSSRPSVRLNGKPFEYAGDTFNARSMAKTLKASIAKRDSSDE
jgi:hypothetical protein